MNKIDLHMHSIVSDDGEFEIQTLIDMAKENEIEIMAVADHNCSGAYLTDFDTKGIHLIPAIELDCTFLGKDFHLLGYGIDPSAEIYKKIEEDILLQEQTATKPATIGRHPLLCLYASACVVVGSGRFPASGFCGSLGQ